LKIEISPLLAFEKRDGLSNGYRMLPEHVRALLKNGKMFAHIF